MRKKWKIILRWILLVVCGSILGINIYFANARSLVGNRLPMPFGYGIAIVLSGSMEPVISKDDLILVKESESYAVDDIVVYQNINSLVVHRIIAIDGDSIITKGDANNVADEPISAADIKGKVLMWNSFAGKCVSFLKTPIGTICIIAAAIALIEIPHRKEKDKDDEERQKIIDEIRRLKEETLE
ncbi:MAG: signal peptidase I [Lachnospiraceae bacterium]|nr:signal peptidase I [Lachnospiraceae bacterium]